MDDGCLQALHSASALSANSDENVDALARNLKQPGSAMKPQRTHVHGNTSLLGQPFQQCSQHACAQGRTRLTTLREQLPHVLALKMCLICDSFIFARSTEVSLTGEGCTGGSLHTASRVKQGASPIRVLPAHRDSPKRIRGATRLPPSLKLSVTHRTTRSLFARVAAATSHRRAAT
eukprot:364899-Chlamydomonas_euryale.AAC.10